MPDLVIVDTDVLIDAGRGIDDAVSCLQQIEEVSFPATSVISEMELVIGCRNKSELYAVEQFLSRFRVVKLNEQISDIANELLHRYRLSHGLLIADALIAATAISWNKPLVSKNQRDYRFVKEIDLLAYPKPFVS